jgi:TPR repeat protein
MASLRSRLGAAAMLNVLLLGCGGTSSAPPTAAADSSSAPPQNRADTAAASAQIATGNAYGVPQDSARALTYYRTAAEQGDAYAQDNLGLMYFTGQGVPQDYVLAATWYRKAAEQGYADAQFNLGALYFTGRGVPQDVVEARKWYNLAASRVPAGDQKRYTEWGEATAKRMAPQQLAAAEKLARDWQAAFETRSKSGSSF